MVYSKCLRTVASALIAVVIAVLGPVDSAQAQDAVYAQKIQQLVQSGLSYEEVIAEILKQYPNVDDATIQALRDGGVDPEFLQFLSMNRQGETGTSDSEENRAQQQADDRQESEDDAREAKEEELDRKIEALEKKYENDPEAFSREVEKLLKDVD